MRVAVQAHRTNAVAFLEAKAPVGHRSAVMAGRADVLRGMLAREPKALANSYLGRDLLHLAAADGNAEITTLLLDAGGDLRACDSWGLSPLGAARLRNRMGLADLLISRSPRGEPLRRRLRWASANRSRAAVRRQIPRARN